MTVVNIPRVVRTNTLCKISERNIKTTGERNAWRSSIIVYLFIYLFVFFFLESLNSITSIFIRRFLASDRCRSVTQSCRGRNTSRYYQHQYLLHVYIVRTKTRRKFYAQTLFAYITRACARRGTRGQRLISIKHRTAESPPSTLRVSGKK